MSARNDRPPRYRRVVLDLPLRQADRRLLQAAAELARSLDAELHAVLVEDPALIALADIPFARELRLPAHEWRPLSATRLAEDTRLAMEKLRHDVDALRAAVGLRGQTELRRGDSGQPADSYYVATDILVLPARVSAASAVGSETRRSLAAYHSAASVMIVPRRHAGRDGSVVAVARTAEDPSIDLATRIARRTGTTLIVLAPPGVRPAVDRDTVVKALPRAHDDSTEILTALRGLRAQLVVITRGVIRPDDDRTLRAIAEDSGVPVLALEPPAR